LHLLVDSTGIKMPGEGEWKTKKHGADYRRQWRKVHLGIDAATLESGLWKLQVRAAILNRSTQYAHDRGGNHGIISPRIWGITSFADLCNKVKSMLQSGRS